MPGKRLSTVIASMLLSACATVPQPGSTTQVDPETRRIVQLYWRAAEAGDASGAAALFAENAVYRDKTFDFQIKGIPAIRSMLADAFKVLQPVKRTIVSETYGNGRAAIEWEAEGTHASEILGIPPSHRRLTIRAVSLISIRRGKILSVTDYTDRAGLEAQLKR